jgi:methylated-DNA-protein-cysteine methyltransferase related protein
MASEGLSPATMAIEAAIKAIPRGRVSTYGEVARDAGFPQGARQVVRVLHSRSIPAKLPWWRVLGKGGGASAARIALSGAGFEEQRAILISEGVEVAENGRIDLARFGWKARSRSIPD